MRKVLHFVIFALALSVLAFGQTYTIQTVVGSSSQGFSGDNGPVSSAQLRGPTGVAVDSAGSLYIADNGNERVRKVSNGVITTVAGNGGAGFSGDNGPATSAQSGHPNGIAVDSAGNLYIPEFLNQRVRKVSNGIITTVAGNGTPGYSGDSGPATSAQLNSPLGSAVDSAGNLYFADAGNHCVRKVSNGVISTVAGNGTHGYSGDSGPATSAQLNTPTGVAVDSAGNLYIADYNNGRVRKVSGGVITTVAGNGVQGSSGDNGPATSAALNGPYGITFDSAGNLYIADARAQRVREVSNGVIITVAGNGTPGFSGDNGPATSAQLNGPQYVAVDSAGRVYIADFNNNRVRVLIPISSATQFIPVTPCRIADTRNPNGPFGGPAIAGNTFRDFVIPNSVCGIPANAAGYSLNVAVVPRGTLGFLTLWPSGQSQPLVATLNSIDGRTKSNAAIVPAGANGAVSVFATNTTDVILDINGYFVAGSNAAALAFYPLTPCRIADTRNAAGPLGGPSLVAQGTRSFLILASSCGLPASAQAYSLNFAAVPRGPTLGFLTAWPAGQTQPLVASLNDPTGTVLANAVVVPAGAGGAVNVFTTDITDLVIDINGYFAPPGAGGLSLYTVPPCRVLDSRLPTGTPPFSTTRDVSVTAAPCGVPATAQAFVFNATVVPPGPLGFITMWPQGQTQPLAATLNATDGAITNNMAIVPTTTGSVSVFPLAPTHLVLDIFGYFAP